MRALAGAEAERERAAAEIEAVRVRDVGVAEAAGEAARVAALRDVPAEVLGALALRELAARLPEIGQLTITPDVLTGLVTRLAVPLAAGRVSPEPSRSAGFRHGESRFPARRVSVSDGESPFSRRRVPVFRRRVSVFRDGRRRRGRRSRGGPS